MSRLVELDCVTEAELRPNAPFAFDLTVYNFDEWDP